MDIIEKIGLDGIDDKRKKEVSNHIKEEYFLHRDVTETNLSVLIKKNYHKKTIAYFKNEVKKSGLKYLNDLLFKDLEMIEYFPHLYIDNKDDYKKAMSIFLKILNKYTSLDYNIKMQVLSAHMLDPYVTKNNAEVYLNGQSKVAIDLQQTINELCKIFSDITKNDTEVNRESLLYDEVIQAFNTSITKLTEVCYQQPRELKHTLIDYKETPIKDYIAVTQNAINHDEDIKLLDKLFLTYKRDMQGRIYNYDLLVFLYYAYSLEISFYHLYHSKLLEYLGAYEHKANREKPTFKNKKNAVIKLQRYKEVSKPLQCHENNIYLDNLMMFMKEANIQHCNKYLLSFIVEISHNLKASKEFMQSLTCKNNFNHDTYTNLPQPINTLLLPYTQIAN